MDAAQVLTALAALVGAIGVIVLGFLTYFGKRASERAEANADAAKIAAEIAGERAASVDDRLIELDGKVYRLGIQLDGPLTKLLTLAEANAMVRVKAARAEGKLEGAAEERAEPKVKANGG